MCKAAVPHRKAPVPDFVRALHKGSTQCPSPAGWSPGRGIHLSAEHQIQPTFSQSSTCGWLLSLRSTQVSSAMWRTHLGVWWGVQHDFLRGEGAASEIFDWLRPVISHTSLWFLLLSVLEAFRIIKMTPAPPLLWSQCSSPSSSKLLQ